MIPGAAFATGEVTAAQLATIPCDVTREGEERRIPGSSGVASRKVRCEYDGSTWGWEEVGAAAIAPTATFSDDTFTVCDDVTPTKCFRLQLSSISAGQTRTWTVPNGSNTFASTTLAQTLTNKTLTSPTIGDFTNAQHDHLDADDGGTLTTAAIPELSAAFTPASASGPASFAFAEDTDNGSSKITVIAPASLSADYTQTLPAANGTIALAPTITIRDQAGGTVANGATESITVNCSAGEVVMGGGYAAVSSNLQVVHTSYPSSTTAWTVQWRNGTGGNAQYRAYAVCAKFGA